MKINNTAEFLSSSVSLISFIEHSDDFWFIKDLTSTYIYMNEAGLDFINCPVGYNIEGRKDKEIPMPPSELWEDFFHHDQKVIQRKAPLGSLEIHFYGRGNKDTPVPHYCTKSPLYDEDRNIIDIVGHGNRISTPALLYFMNRLNTKKLVFDAPHDTFSQRELEVAFWLQQKLSVKQIAYRLNVAESTIKKQLQMMYQKADVGSQREFTEYCIATGLDKYMPSNFLKNGTQLLE